MSSRDLDDMKTPTLRSLVGSIDGQLQELMKQRGELVNNLNCLAVMALGETLSSVQRREVLMALRLSYQQAKALRRAICTAVHTLA